MGLAAADAIHVGKDGLLVMTPTVHAVNVATITLESDARLRFESGYVNVVCDTLSGPDERLFHLTPRLIEAFLGLHLGTSPAENPIDPRLLPEDAHAHKYLPGYSQEHMFVSADYS